MAGSVGSDPARIALREGKRMRQGCDSNEEACSLAVGAKLESPVSLSLNGPYKQIYISSLRGKVCLSTMYHKEPRKSTSKVGIMRSITSAAHT